MGQAPIRAAAHVLRHAVGVLLLSWLRALQAGFIAGIVGVLLVELGAMVMSRHFPPDGNAQLVAALFGFALGLAAAMTAVVDEMLQGFRELVEMLSGEADAGARVASAALEREVGESSAALLRRVGLGRLLGQQRSQRARALFGAGEQAADSPRAGARLSWEHNARTDETLTELAAEARAPSHPPPQVMPVRADQLPRLGWSDELPAVRPTTAEPPHRTAPEQPHGELPAALSMPNQPDTLEAKPPTATPTEVVDQVAAEPDASSTPTAPAATSGLVEPRQWHATELTPADFGWHDPLQAIEEQDDEESYIQPIDVFGAPPPLAAAGSTEPLSRPLSSAASSTPEIAPETGPRGSVWDHISQVLAGRPASRPLEAPQANGSDDRSRPDDDQ